MNDRIQRSLSELAPDRRELTIRLVAQGEADPRDARYVGLSTALRIGDKATIEAWMDAIEGGERYGHGAAWKTALDGLDRLMEEDDEP